MLHKMLIFRNTVLKKKSLKEIREISKKIKESWITKIGLVRFHLEIEDLFANKTPQYIPILFVLN